MRPGFDRFRRPMLGVTRSDTETACMVEGIEWWTDPHNADPRFTRSRVRTTVLPMLEQELGPGVAEALARTADLLREDAEALDNLAAQELQRLRTGDGLAIAELSALDLALRHRVIRRAAIDAGSIDSELTRAHVLTVAAMALAPEGGKQIQLPGHVTAYRAAGVLRFRRTEPD